MKDENIIFSDKAILAIIRNYTREAGVRNLEREIASVCRKVAKEVLKKGKDTKINVSSNSIYQYLGVTKFRFGKTEEKDQIGVTTDCLDRSRRRTAPDRSRHHARQRKLVLTGKLGEVMQESAQAALSYVRSRAEQLGLEKVSIENIDIHIHVPEGAMPKDGPSAGIALATSIVSALTRKPVRQRFRHDRRDHPEGQGAAHRRA